MIETFRKEEYYNIGPNYENMLFRRLGKPPFQKSAVFFNIVQKAFDPPPFYLNICPILRGVFFKRIFEH